MIIQKNEWYYLDDQNGAWEGPLTLDQLDELRRGGKIEEYTQVITPNYLADRGRWGAAYVFDDFPACDRA